ncbi:hypothetical protein ACFQ7A_04780 [Streptomyces sp. NPDC056528]|uniref:hypothetical protein n=1 Tax=Streptomyces sp. NPDC056528 TaxID=3345854 RepID=UPI00369C1D90
MLLALLHALLDLAARAVPNGDPLAALDHLLGAASGGLGLVQLLRRRRGNDRRRPEVSASGATVPPMNTDTVTPARRSLGARLSSPFLLELYAWLLAGALLDLLIRCGGQDFDPSSPWHLSLGLLALGAVRTGLVRWGVRLRRRS